MTVASRGLFKFFRNFKKRLPIVGWGNSLAKAWEATGNLLANLLKGVRGYWQPSYKFIIGCQRVLLQIP